MRLIAVGIAIMGTALATSGLRAGFLIVALCVAVGAAPVIHALSKARSGSSGVGL
ncbi:hypothetical protein [Streptosporangium saharense]|uniref:Uncharacterized protein n=1 Tax=Streptosporangium saharense TaxID=1706840 RepID=A0A7W7QV70_9ACTN|nr:hypothetical protein [Streptosporangium saharense]MBB4919811.1 hypothetical protein [Streptosporangium saharense]